MDFESVAGDLTSINQSGISTVSNLCKQQIYTISEKFEFDRIPEATKRKSTKAYVRRCMYMYLPHIYILT